MKQNKIKIGFPFKRKKGGPELFMKQLKNSFEKQKLFKASIYLNPLVDIIFDKYIYNVS